MAGFWEWRGKAQTATVAELDIKEALLEPVELYTESGMVFGFVEPEGRRLSDMLNSNSHLSIRDARSTSMINGIEGTQG